MSTSSSSLSCSEFKESKFMDYTRACLQGNSGSASDDNPRRVDGFEAILERVGSMLNSTGGDLNGKIRKLEEYTHQNQEAVSQACKLEDATDIAWFEAALAGRQENNPIFVHWIREFKRINRAIYEVGKRGDLVAKGQNAASRILKEKAEAASNNVQARNLKQNQIEPIVEGLKLAHESAVTFLGMSETFREQYLIVQQIAADPRGEIIGERALEALEMLGGADREIVRKCVLATRAQKWAGYEALAKLDKACKNVPEELASFEAVYNRLARQAGMVPLTGSPNLVQTAPLPNQPTEVNEVNWKSLGIQICRGELQIHAGIKAKLGGIRSLIGEIHGILSSANQIRKSYDDLHRCILERWDTLWGFASLNSEGGEPRNIGALYDCYHTLAVKSNRHSDEYFKQLAFLRVELMVEPRIMSEHIKAIAAWGFDLTLPGDQTTEDAYLGCHNSYTELAREQTTRWKPDNDLEENIRWDFDRLCWGLMGYYVPRWENRIPVFGRFMNWLDPREWAFQWSRHAHPENSSFIKGNRDNLPLDRID